MDRRQNLLKTKNLSHLPPGWHSDGGGLYLVVSDNGHGLMSYGTDRADAYRIMGTYAARMLKGEKPVDLPAQPSTQVRLAINLKTAKSFGLSFPVTFLGRADEVIE
jgi:hypothetical protein